MSFKNEKNKKNSFLNKNKKVDVSVSDAINEAFDNVELSTVGKLCLDARLNKGLTQEQAGALLKVRVKIIKDFEDQFGDSKMGYNTFAIVSAKTAKITVQIISVLLITIIGWISYLQITYDELYAAIYVLLSIELPLVYFFIKLRTASDKKTYHQLSQLIKLIMLTGTLSILVFTLLF